MLDPLPAIPGWHVSIGRARSTKRFNLTRGEAAELCRQLLAVLPEVGESTRGQP